MNVPKELDAIADVVLAYKPPEKAKAAKMYIIPLKNSRLSAMMRSHFSPTSTSSFKIVPW